MPAKQKRRPLLVADIQVGAICFEAKQFAEAGRRCLADMKDGVIPGPVSPGIVCTAFSVELWFKALYCATNPTGEVPTGHDLFLLFSKLPSNVQGAVIERSGHTTERFLQSLQADAKTFETWRYGYEHGAREPTPKDGLLVLTVHLLLQNVLPKACEEVYGELYR